VARPPLGHLSGGSSQCEDGDLRRTRSWPCDFFTSDTGSSSGSRCCSLSDRHPPVHVAGVGDGRMHPGWV